METPTRPSWAWLRERIFPRGTGLLFWASYAIILILIVTFVLTPHSITTAYFYLTILVLTALLVLTVLWNDIEFLFPRKHIGTWALLVISTLLAYLATYLGEEGNTIYLIFMVGAMANAMVAFVPALLFSLAAFGGWIAIVMLGLHYSPSSLPSLLYGIMVGMTFTTILVQVLNRFSEQTHRTNELLKQLQAVNEELVAARQKETELAIAEERVRVARDLHDGLGHHLTALSIQLQAVEKLVRANPDKAAEAAHNARTEVQAALKEVRGSVATLREAPVDIRHLPDAIARLVDETGSRARLEASFEQKGETTDLAPATAMTLYRTAQEGLTNIQKHAQNASRVRVCLAYEAEKVELSIWDDGVEQQAGAEGDEKRGYGLAGLSERAALLGGSFECGPAEGGGFLLAMRLPVDGGEP